MAEDVICFELQNQKVLQTLLLYETMRHWIKNLFMKAKLKKPSDIIFSYNETAAFPSASLLLPSAIQSPSSYHRIYQLQVSS